MAKGARLVTRRARVPWGAHAGCAVGLKAVAVIRAASGARALEHQPGIQLRGGQRPAGQKVRIQVEHAEFGHIPVEEGSRDARVSEGIVIQIQVGKRGACQPPRTRALNAPGEFSEGTGVDGAHTVP